MLALLLVPIGCSKDEVVDITRYRTVVIRVPADTYLGQRTPGDPGVVSTLQIPRYLYFFTALPHSILRREIRGLKYRPYVWIRLHLILGFPYPMPPGRL